MIGQMVTDQYMDHIGDELLHSVHVGTDVEEGLVFQMHGNRSFHRIVVNTLTNNQTKENPLD